MKIVCLDAATLGDVNLAKFRDFGEFICYDNTQSKDRIQRLKDADIVLTNKVIIDKEVMDNTNLKLICVMATGTNNIDLSYAKSKGIVVKNVAGYSTNGVVQQVFASLFYLRNKMRYYDEWVKSGQWIKSELFANVSKNIYEIHSKRFGIIGLGEIGLSVARIAKAFGSDVVYHSTSGKNNSREFPSVSLDALLKTCDIISIHCSLNDETLNLIDRDELNKLKDGAIIMNFARGGVVNEKALAEILDKREIYAVFDVLQNEPMSANSPFVSVKNKDKFLITPHIAWSSYESRLKLVNLVYKNIQDFLKA